MPVKPITTSVTWHPGGAVLGGDGKPTPWPWGESCESPIVVASETSRLVNHRRIVLTSIRRESWSNVVCYCDPKSFEPPTFNAKGDADEIG
jgi:hypothetical protein